MSEQFRPTYQPLEERPEYQEATTEELEITTDLIDELLIPSENRASGAVRSVSSSDALHTSISQSFSYVERGAHSGLTLWPPSEAEVTLSYSKDKRQPTKEYYQVAISHTIHQTGINPPPLLSVYTIEYFGEQRESAKATIEANDVLNDSPFSLEARPITRYDNEQGLFQELSFITRLQFTQAHEQSILDHLD